MRASHYTADGPFRRCFQTMDWLRRRMRLPILLTAMTVLLVARFQPSSCADTQEPEKSPKPPATVSLVIDFGDGAQKVYPAIPWKQGMKGSDLLEFARQHRHGIQIKSRGSGARTLLLKIDDLANEGSGGKNWIFRVNGELGDRSYAVTDVAAKDRILWKFDTYR